MKKDTIFYFGRPTIKSKKNKEVTVLKKGKKGLLIIIDSGSDGSGKATQTKALTERLLQEGYPVKQITFPNYDSPACEPVKMYLEGAFGTNPDSVNAYAASTFYAIDRFASFKQDWQSDYENGMIIISDRYTTSNMIHQGIKMETAQRETYLSWLEELEFTHFGLPKPDVTFFLDVSPEMTQKLRQGRLNKMNGSEEQDIHERNEAYLTQCYENGIELATRQEWIRVRCDENQQMRSIESIHNEIYETLITLIKKHYS